ncbi:type I restriction endonuclease [Candidatus Bathycorpusculum sp.]|uniref:type I restriction endonuclease n=1 Tax=Candidatus Bathycorpusculum sp. TaxID=2994959 RepID=UPI00281962E9|nr:type I restriction endonuclease [Candidatus Termitimicrobium sp.]
MFYESDLEQLLVDIISKNGWEYISADKLRRSHADVLVESMVRDALIRLNPEIATKPEYADDVIYKLIAVIRSVQPHNLVTQNEQFKKLVFEENSYPFGEDGRMIPIRFFGTGVDLKLNKYVVTNQWVFPKDVGGKRLDIVLLINGFPVAVGELKTPTRNAVTWLDGAGDILAYEKSIPQMFVPNVFNFASEGKCFRFGAVNMPLHLWGPWHTLDKTEGTLADVNRSVAAMFKPEIIMDIFQFFTVLL